MIIFGVLLGFLMTPAETGHPNKKTIALPEVKQVRGDSCQISEQSGIK